MSEHLPSLDEARSDEADFMVCVQYTAHSRRWLMSFSRAHMDAPGWDECPELHYFGRSRPDPEVRDQALRTAAGVERTSQWGWREIETEKGYYLSAFAYVRKVRDREVSSV